MTKKALIFLLVILGFFRQGQAQEVADYHFNISLARGLDPSVHHLELGLNKDLFNFFDSRLQLGFGIRMGVQDNVDPILTTAFKEYKAEEAWMDTLSLGRVQSVNFNLQAQAQYYLNKRWAVGCNVDLLGITKGLETEGDYLPGSSSQIAGFQRQNNVNAKPTEANAFSFADQKGTLNSQLYLRLDASRKVSLKFGLAFLMTEYTTEKTFGSKQQYRFENNVGAYFLGISFNKFDES